MCTSFVASGSCLRKRDWLHTSNPATWGNRTGQQGNELGNELGGGYSGTRGVLRRHDDTSRGLEEGHVSWAAVQGRLDRPMMARHSSNVMSEECGTVCETATSGSQGLLADIARIWGGRAAAVVGQHWGMHRNQKERHMARRRAVPGCDGDAASPHSSIQAKRRRRQRLHSDNGPQKTALHCVKTRWHMYRLSGADAVTSSYLSQNTFCKRCPRLPELSATGWSKRRWAAWHHRFAPFQGTGFSQHSPGAVGAFQSTWALCNHTSLVLRVGCFGQHLESVAFSVFLSNKPDPCLTCRNMATHSITLRGLSGRKVIGEYLSKEATVCFFS
jgi:hypothetical protein